MVMNCWFTLCPTGIEGFRNVVAVGQVLAMETDGASPVFRLRP